ncbi:MAG TPA: PfkB family carbohydrate kinase [Bryobacteraceae bacterium]|nr:PfkB family carbohydrate kinase [Bryobacteraceae bacterium]
MNSAARFDVVGVGLNATDTLLAVPHFPPYGGKVALKHEVASPGGQVATAMAVCSRLGLRAKYIGAVGDDEAGRIQMASLRAENMDIEDVEIRANCANQRAYIIIDQSSGERTILWRRHDCLRIDPEHISPEKIACARLLHVDGHDTPAVARAAKIARDHGIPVSVDVDTIYPGFGEVLALTDFLVSSTEFPEKWTGESDPFRALEKIQREYRMRVAAMTLGSDGALARSNGRFFYSPGFVVQCADTTGAGDVFHGAFCYAVLAGMELRETLEFSNAMAALNCTRLGARGGIASEREARALMTPSVKRRSNPDFAAAGRGA